MPAYVAIVIGPEILDKEASPATIFHKTRSVNVDISQVFTVAFINDSVTEYSIRVINICLISSGKYW